MRFALAFIGLLLSALVSLPGRAQQDPAAEDWLAVLAAARGQTVYFNAWGGEERINDYIAWAAEALAARHGITLVHVKLADTGEAVARILAEQAAGQDAAGSVDLIWINGENFAAMKANGLLHGPFVEALPNFALVDIRNNPSALSDFGVPTEGLEAPWGRAQLNLLYDRAAVAEPPGSMAALLLWAEANPGRFAYPAPPDFLGTSFLKQALIELTADGDLLAAPPADEAAFAQVTAPLWAYLDALHPHLWRAGRAFPQSGPALRQLFADGEVDFALSFNPGEAAAAVTQGLLPDSTGAYLFDGGSLGNTHFLAIPYNARAKAGALAAIDFLLSPEAQARKLDPAVWGDPTVLDLERLPAAQAAFFTAMPPPLAPLHPEGTALTLPEPHPAWSRALEQAWLARYAR